MAKRAEHIIKDETEKKKCTICGEYKELFHFSKIKRYSDGLNYKCKKCNSQYFKKYRIDNIQLMTEIVNRAKRKRRKASGEFINENKAGGCVLCGYSKCLAALEYHHVNGDKEQIVTRLRDNSTDKIATEISKCIVVCANCHREIHHMKKEVG